MSKVAVLLSTYNGEKYLKELLDSVFAQKGVEVSVIVRDDGSSDGTVAILKQYGKQHSLYLIQGDNIGYKKSFWSLLKEASRIGADYYAFADQDDIWLPQKLKTCLETISSISGPALCTGTVIPIDANGNRLKGDPFPIHGPLSLPESLQRSILPGCTFVFNEEARRICSMYNGYIESHDWAMYAIVTALGTVIYSEAAGVLYRLHGENTIGAPSRISELRQKVSRFVSGNARVRSRFAMDMLITYHDYLKQNDLQIIALMANANKSLSTRMELASSSMFHGLIFKTYALLGRI